MREINLILDSEVIKDKKICKVIYTKLPLLFFRFSFAVLITFKTKKYFFVHFFFIFFYFLIFFAVLNTFKTKKIFFRPFFYLFFFRVKYI